MLAMASGENTSKKPAPTPVDKNNSPPSTAVKKPAAPVRTAATPAGRPVPSKPVAKPAMKPAKAPPAQSSLKRPPQKLSAQESKRPHLSTPVASAPATPDGIAKKKFSFKDIMKKAETLDKDKFRLQVKTRGRKPDAPKQTKTAALLAAKPAKPAPRQPSPAEKQPLKRSSGPAPIALPSAKLAEKLRRKSSVAQDRDDDMDDFIDDDEEEEEPSYRDEIWKLFNRGRSRSDFVDDYSDDDMEATSADVLAEEMKSARQARREDQEEEARLQRLAAEKARKKAQKGL
ncbi:hypothetical protein B9G98_00837 [Wickerhamiella sorbophila]|uniref:Protein SPT2 n=1 Tax=Wickerhamiella sorbophila TaxID=45607 RepID=A0A2T0FE27_9ASCO|nr:hypothetical protein B9G98_00837 [Wickerhamiella sorbophila]PRT53217.1 hypothetical protein B9G98_00837 [Wickerhamiella sorbophila]